MKQLWWYRKWGKIQQPTGTQFKWINKDIYFYMKITCISDADFCFTRGYRVDEVRLPACEKWAGKWSNSMGWMIWYWPAQLTVGVRGDIGQIIECDRTGINVEMIWGVFWKQHPDGGGFYWPQSVYHTHWSILPMVGQSLAQQVLITDRLGK